MDRNSLLRILICTTRPKDEIGENVRELDGAVRTEIAKYQEASIIDTDTARELAAIWEGYTYAVGAHRTPWKDQHNYASAVIRTLGQV